MNEAIFERFRDLIYQKSGISLGPQKAALVSARVGKRMRALGIDDYADYLDYVSNDASGQEIVQLLDVISTNVTSFYREPRHFDLLTELLQEWRNKKQTRYRIWCAAASTGEEPYTIGITAIEALRNYSCDFKLLATDISTRVLQVCKQGRYPASKVEAVPYSLRGKHFSKCLIDGDEQYVVSDELRRLISFGRLNLADPPFPMKGPFDVIFCRNVMIYFDNVVRSRLVDEMFRLLRPGGYLMVGHSESLNAYSGAFRSVQPSVYKKP